MVKVVKCQRSCLSPQEGAINSSIPIILSPHLTSIWMNRDGEGEEEQEEEEKNDEELGQR